MQGRILIVDDDRDMCEVIAAKMRKRDLDPQSFTSAAEAIDVLRSETFDVVLTDLKMPGMDGVELCRQIVESRPDVPVLVITAFGSLETAVAAIRAGAYDFVTKPIEMDLLALAVDRALQHRRLQEQVKRLSETVEQTLQFGELIGESPPMTTLYEHLGRFAGTDATVLITGESGTGKELVARVLHRGSGRAGGPLLAVNCSALPESLLESELFGHTKGAFTDACSARDGLFVGADGGTLFLDEIGEMPLALQPKLLRALEERRVRPVGSSEERAFDVRLLAATNRDLESDVEAGRFREDLFYRINVIRVDLPPLRSRGTDVLLLAQHFTRQIAKRFDRPVTGISEATARKLLTYDWPGNVRELRNAIEHAVVVTQFEKLAVEDLPDRIRAHKATQLIVAGNDPAEFVPMEEIERRYILHVLNAFGGNRTKTAQVLGLGRKTLYRKLQNYGVAGQEGDH